ncbi:MAG: CPBP family intramembrane metalloprotease [Cyclobacteriaceae bacterium]|nr:CPBP family intramembrane metalloprotease [Cyclobacteriaceae bacterium]MDH4294913.1 CPBP family intramembrane metalloprotease [Cyclobacteriaceae bacterium]MDH5249370.1 CPBP family intramembrane metalloprotease [Cyclobacteriaceae bacterium]
MFTPQNIVSDKPPFQSLLRITLNVILGFVIVGPLLGFAVASSFYGGDLLGDLEKTTGQPGLVGAILLMQAIVTFIGLILFPIIHITQLEHKPLKPFFPSNSQTLLMLLLVAGVGLTFPISISPLAEWNLNFKFPEFMSGFENWAMHEEERLGKLTALITDFKSAGDMLIGVLVIALLPAIGEELVFRGMIQRELWRGTQNIHLAIWVSSAIFSAIHMQFYGFVPRLLLGALFGYLYYWSGSLMIPMFSHFFNNAFAVVMVYLNHMEITSINIEDGEAMPWPYVITCFILTAGLLYYIWRHYFESPPKHGSPNNSLSHQDATV